MPRLEVVAETASTNADLLALAASGHGEDGLWLRAERQSAGRGRLGRTWEDAAGNLFASTMVRLRPGDPPAPGLALVAGVAAYEAVRGNLSPALHLKWPNDLMVGEAKLAGMLLERTGEWVVIGIGMNVATAPALPDRATTSLHAAGADPAIDAHQVCAAIADRLAHWLDRWRTEGLAPVIAAWTAAAHPIGTALWIVEPDGATRSGTFDGLTGEGALILRLADGAAHVMHAGDVFTL
jgi:BirA family biotin operon repressor/biotin-[acetyl-CoA-carboxylase] ligase